MSENLTTAPATCPLSRGNGELGADCGAQTSIDRTCFIGQQAEREFIFSGVVSVDASIDRRAAGQARFHVGRVVDEKRTKVERRAAHRTLRVGRRGLAGPFGTTSAKHDSDEKCETRFVIKNES